MITEEFLDKIIKYWPLIIPIVGAIAYFLVSPFVSFRIMRKKKKAEERTIDVAEQKKEVEEVQLFIEKNQLIRAEINEIHDELGEHRKRIAALEEDLLQERLKVIRLTSENKTLLAENTALKNSDEQI